LALFTGTYVFRLTMHGSLYGAPCDNVFFYGSNEVGANSTGLRSAFATNVIGHILDLLSEDYNHDRLEIAGVRGIFDFSNESLDAPGEVADSAEPRFVAYSFRYNRASGLERHGFKRFAGVPDGAWIDGSLDPDVRSDLDSLASFLTGHISDSGITYQPLIPRFFENKVELDPPLYYSFSTASFVGVSTQNTRK